MAIQVGEWALGCACVKCLRKNALLRDPLEGEGAVKPPFSGAFRFRCVHCRADNKTDAADLQRFRVTSNARVTSV